MSRILIVEDEAIIAEDLSMILQKEGHTVCGIANDGATALDFIHNRKPEIILLDISLGTSISGLEVAEIINQKYHLPFIFITSFSDQYTLEKVRDLQPEGYIMKPFKRKDVIANVNILSFKTEHKPTGKFKTFEEINAELFTPLTPKEYELVIDLAIGKSNTDMASDHNISHNTVKTHLKRIFSKMEVDSRTVAAVKIVRD